MARKSMIGGFALVGIGVVLGTTVFRNDIAQATGLAPAPSNTAVAQPPLAVAVLGDVHEVARDRANRRPGAGNRCSHKAARHVLSRIGVDPGKRCAGG